jgi:PAS domain S-box-containing protein
METGIKIQAGDGEALNPPESICGRARELFNSRHAFFVEPDGQGNLDVSHSAGDDAGLAKLYRDYVIPVVERTVMENRAPLIIPDTSRDPSFLVNYHARIPGYSLLSFPIFSRNRITGIVSLYRGLDEGFGSDSIRKIYDFSIWAGNLIEQSVQVEARKANEKKLEVLQRAVRTIATIKELDKAADYVSGLIKEVLPVRECGTFFFKDDSEWSGLAPEVRRVLAKGVPGLLRSDGKEERLITPITYQELMPGFIDMHGKGLARYKDLSSTMASLLGAAARRISLDEEIHSSRSKILALEEIARYELSGVLSSSTRLSTILDSTLELIIHLMRVERVNIMLYNEKTKLLKVQAYWGIDDKPFGRETLALGEGVAGHALKTGKPHYKYEEHDSVFVESPGGQDEVRSLLAYPMVVEGRKVGVINIGSIYHDRVFSQDEIRTISLIASRTALAIENSNLRKEQDRLIKEITVNNRKLQEKNVKLTERSKRLSELTRQLEASLGATERMNNRLTELHRLSNRILGSRDTEFIMDSALDFAGRVVSKPARVMAIIIISKTGAANKVRVSKETAPRYAEFLEKFSHNAPTSLSDPIVKERKNIILHSLDASTHVEKLKLMKDLRSFYAFPLFNNERTFGAFILGSSRESLLSDEDVEFLSTVVNHVAVSLDNAEKYRELEMRSEMLSRLNRMTSEIIFSKGQVNPLDKLVEMSCKLMEQQYALLLLYNQWGQLEVKAKYGQRDVFAEHMNNREIRMIIEEVISRNQVYYSSADYERLVKRFSLLTKTGIKSLVILPLKSKGATIGALMTGDDNPRIHTVQLLEFYKLFASHLAITIDNALLMSGILLEKGRISSVFESMKEGVISMDWERKITDFNRAAEEITGYSQEEALGRHCHEILRCKEDPLTGKCLDICPLMDLIGTGDKGPGSVRSEGRFKRKDGGERDIAVTSSLLSQGGDPVGGVLVFRDITEEKAFQARRSDYLAAISHDIFTPLTAMKGYVTTLLVHQDKFDAHMQKDFMRVINSEIDRMTRLLYNLMSLSRMESDKLEAMAGPQVLQGMVSKIVDLYSLSARNHQIVIDPGLENLPMVYVDADHVDQIMSNLISNAIKYSPGGGQVRISAVEKDGFVQVSVSDQGIGIDRKNLQRIFDRYQRVITKESRSISGMGLGLFITRVLVEMQGGRIWAEQSPGGGTVFSFTLPVFRPELFDGDEDEEC